MTNYKSYLKSVLKEYYVGEIIMVNDQSHGYANQNFSVQTTEGDLFIRFCIQQEFTNVEQEIILMDVLKKNDFKTAYPIQRRDGGYISLQNKRPVVVYQYLDGELPKLNFDSVSEIAHAIGELSLIKYPDNLNKINTISPSDSKEIISSEVFRDFAHTDVTENFTQLFGYIEASLDIVVPQGIVHGDVFPDNTLFANNKLVGLIDFEEFAIDNLLFDIGMTINGFCFDGVEFDADLFTTFIREYNSVRPLTHIETELLVDYMCWGAVGMSSWHLHQLLYKKNKKQLDRVRVLLSRASWIWKEKNFLESIISL